MESPTKAKTMVSAVLTIPGNPTSRFPPKPKPEGGAGAEYVAMENKEWNEIGGCMNQNFVVLYLSHLYRVRLSNKNWCGPIRLFVTDNIINLTYCWHMEQWCMRGQFPSHLM